MQYPQRLLPKSNYKLIEWAGWLEDCFLLRHTPDNDLQDPDTGMLKLDYIVPEHGASQLRDFSTSLLGTFLPEDRHWAIRGERRAYFLYELWTEGETVDAPVFSEDFEREESRGIFFLKIGDIVGQEVSYTIGGQGDFTAVCKVKHTPNRSNFWHFSVRWFNEDGDIYPDQRGKWVDRMLKTSVKTLIQEHAKFDAPEGQPISAAHYIA